MDASARCFYDREYALLYRDRVAEVPQQMAFLERHAGAAKGARVLDLGCGYGRHAVALAARGCLVVGVDYSLPLLCKARQRAAHQAAGRGLQLVCADMTALPLRREPTFDLALLLFVTLGQLPADAGQALLGEVRARLKTGGRLVVDVLSADWHRTWAPEKTEWHPVGAPEVLVRDVQRSAPDGSVLIRRTVLRGGREEQYTLSQRLFTPEGLSGLLRKAGYEKVRLFGDWQDRGPEACCHIVAVATA